MRRAALVATVLAALAHPAGAQQPDRIAETEALREVSALEARGHERAAVIVLERLLSTHPTALGALFALDRLLDAQGRSADLLPLTSRFLAADPNVPAVRYLRLRLLAEAGSNDALKRETAEWIHAAPTDVDRYRQVAPFWERAFGIETTLELLRKGRAASGRVDGLAAEIGDLLLKSDRVEDAAVEWARAVAAASESVSEVIRRIRLLHPDVRGGFVDVIVGALDAPGAGVEQRMAAVQLALAGDRPERALRVAQAVAPELDRSSRAAFMQELARWGQDARAPQVAIWALSTLRDAMDGGVEIRALDQRISELAMASGDTAAAVQAGGRLAAAAPPGSPARRRLLASQLRIEVQSADPTELQERFSRFRREFPDAPELDELAAAVSLALQRRDRVEAAERVISDVQGPRTSYERAYLALERGELQLASAALVQAVDGLLPARATEAIQLTTLLGRLSEPSAHAVARSAVAAHRGSARPAALELEHASTELPEADRPAVLAHAARLADGGQAPDQAARMRGVLVERWPDAIESAEAALVLARWHARTSAGVPTAVRLLEELILRSPGSAVVPEARRDLRRLRGSA